MSGAAQRLFDVGGEVVGWDVGSARQRFNGQHWCASCKKPPEPQIAGCLNSSGN